MDSTSSSYSPRRRSLRDDLVAGGGGDDLELEEGEYVPGRDDSSDTDDDGAAAAYRFQHVAPPRSPSSCESEGTISDDGSDPTSVVNAGAPAAARRFACHVCGRAFRSPKAVDGHMRVHGNVRHVAAAAVVAGGWAATGKRGWTGGKPSVVAVVSRNNPESTDHSTAIVAAVRPLEPMPISAIAAMPNLSAAQVLSSMRTNLSGEDTSSASAEPMQYEPVATPNPSSTGAVVHQQAAPPSAADHQQAHPVHQLPAVAPPLATQQVQSIQHQPLVSPPPARPPAQQPRREYSCKLCGKTYATHQGLGGHAAGHRNRQKEAEAAAAAAAGMMMGDGADAFLAALRRGGRKVEEPHECQKCHKVFATGVALGGHMRMHYTGPPIVHKKSKKRCLAPPPPLMSGADLRLALSTTIKEEPSPVAPAVAAGRVRLFGIDIGPQVQTPSEEQGSGTAEGSSSSAGEQQ